VRATRFVAVVTPPDRVAPLVRIDSIGSITAGTTVFIDPTVGCRRLPIGITTSRGYPDIVQKWLLR
jgi:hypothetical protein